MATGFQQDCCNVPIQILPLWSLGGFRRHCCLPGSRAFPLPLAKSLLIGAALRCGILLRPELCTAEFDLEGSLCGRQLLLHWQWLLLLLWLSS